MESINELAKRYDCVEFVRKSDTCFSQVLLRAAAHAIKDSIVVKYEHDHERLFPSGARSGMVEHIDLIPHSLRREGKQGESLLSLERRLQLN